MNISMNDVKLLIGELFIENKILYKQIASLEAELEEIKKGTQNNGVPFLEKENKTKQTDQE